MRIKKRLIFTVPVLLMLIFLSACGAGAGRYELTHYIGKSVASFERKSGLKLEEQSNGVYLRKDVAQVMVTGKKVNSVTLLENADQYMIYGVKVGMTKEEADSLLHDTFGSEITKTTNSEKNSVTYSYLKNGKELYITYDIDTNTVVGISYYKTVSSKKGKASDESANAGELMAMIGDTRVYYNEAMVYLKSAMEKYEAEYGKGIWSAKILGNGKTFGSMIKDEVIKQITELKIIRSEAEKQDISLTEDEVAEAASYAKEHYDGLTEEDKNKYLVTKELLHQVYTDNLLASKMFEKLTINVDNKVSDEEAKQITVQDIMIYNTNLDEKGNKVPFTEEEKQAAYEKVKSLYEQARETKDFRALAEANTEADTVEYTFGKGQGPKEYSAEFENAAFALKTGEVSNIIATDYGWHIIYCVSDYNEDATIQYKEKVIEDRRNEMFSKLYSDWAKNYNVIINNEAWDAIPFE